MNFSNGFVLCFVLFGFILNDVRGCNDYKARIISIENCNGTDAVMMLDKDMSVKLTKKCEFVPKGCVTSKGFKDATVTYKVLKDNVKVAEGKKNVCKEMESAGEQVKQAMQMLSLPISCPVSEGKVCGDDKKLPLDSQQKAMLPMAKGKTHVELFFEHDTGTSCVIADFQVYKP